VKVKRIEKIETYFYLILTMSKIELLKASPVLLIDTSYYIFYRFHASARWYSFKDATTPIDELTQQPAYLEAFFKHHNQDMKTLLKKQKILPQNMLWCLDAPRQEIWRMNYHTDYKGTREQARFDSRIFPIFYKYLKEQNQRLVQYPSLEADDVVALIHQNVRQQEPTQSMLIITNDNDYLQLCSSTTKIMNMQGKDLSLRGSGSPEKDVLIKILMGDKSDNIPPTFAKCGVKTAQQIASMSEEERTNFLQQKNALEQFNKNKTLICFDSIPNDLRERFLQKYELTLI